MKTTHQLCEGRFGVAVGVSLDKSSVADAVAANGLNQLYRRLCGRASNSSTLRTGTTTKLPYETPAAAIRFQYFRSRLNTEVVKTHRRRLGILAEAARSDGL